MPLRPLLFSGLVALWTATHALSAGALEIWTNWLSGWLASAESGRSEGSASPSHQPAAEPRMRRTAAVAGTSAAAVAVREVARAERDRPAVNPPRDENALAPEEPKLDPPELIALSRRTLVFSAPRPGAERVGYLRTGARVVRGSEAVSYEGCRRGWYRIAPFGFACLDESATLDPTHPVAVLATTRPDRYAALPYVYGTTGGGTPPLYSRLPSRTEQQRVESWLPSARHRLVKDWQEVPIANVPELLRGGRSLPTPFGFARSDAPLVLGQARARAGFGFLGFYDSDGRVLGLSTDMSFVPVDRLRKVVASGFSGVRLTEKDSLPLAFVMSRRAFLYGGHPKRRGLTLVRGLDYREALTLSGETERLGRTRYLATTRGEWIVDRDLVRVDPVRSLPQFATGGRKWIDVSLSRQTLVAYEGTKPVFVTLVSTGSDGPEVAEPKRATIQGIFRVHTKHVTATMQSDEVGDEYELLDVPYVQYFSEGYALHGVYWHDEFGQRKSHGCVNLSPKDARWLFQFTDPPVPLAWHGAMAKQGTRIYIHL